MEKTEQSPIRKFPRQGWTFHLLVFISILAALLLLRSPLLINSDYFFDSDEAFNALEILWLMRGAPIFFYHEYVGYQGILNGLSAIPFFWILGPTALAYKLPAVFFFALFIWSTFVLVRLIHPPAGWIALFLLMFSPPALTNFSTQNFPHVLISLLGNVLFILFIQAKTSSRHLDQRVFLFFATMGLAIYSYTLVFLHIFTLFVLFVLTHPFWPVIRGHLSMTAVIGHFKRLGTRREKLARVLDAVIFMFFLAIIFSYVWGGFDIEIGGVTLFQINRLHKPVFQVLGLIALRLAIHRADLPDIKEKLTAPFRTIGAETQRRAWLALMGFVIGISPRLASILTGQTKKGGAGFDTDIIPMNWIRQLWNFFSDALPRTLGLYEPGADSSLFSALFVLVLGLFLVSADAFYQSQWSALKPIVKLRKVEFQPMMILALFPLVTCAAVAVSKIYPMPRYFITLYAILVIWVAFFLEKVKGRSLAAFVLLLVVWGGFYSHANYRVFARHGVIQGLQPVKRSEPLYDVIGFVKALNLPIAYAQYWNAHKATFLSRETLVVGDYSSRPIKGIAQKEKLAGVDRFAIIIAREEPRKTFQNYLREKRIGYQQKQLGRFTILWDFDGGRGAIDGLRSLIKE